MNTRKVPSTSNRHLAHTPIDNTVPKKRNLSYGGSSQIHYSRDHRKVEKQEKGWHVTSSGQVAEMAKCCRPSHPMLPANVVLQLDLHIPNFEALNLNTSTVFVRLEMSKRTQNFTHEGLLRVVILLHNFYEHFNARPHQVRLDRTHELVWQETCFPHSLSFFLLRLCGVATASQDG